MATDTTELVSRQEAARLAGVHVNTIRLWEDGGRLHPVKQENGRVMIPLSELEEVVKERQQHPEGEHDRLIAAEAEVKALRSENELLRETLTQLREEHGRLLDKVLSLTRGEGEA